MPPGDTLPQMKSAYELAMERLKGGTPSAPLSKAQRGELAELDAVYQARVAEKDLAMQAAVAGLLAQGDEEQANAARARFVAEKQELLQELESRKDAVRHPGR